MQYKRQVVRPIILCTLKIFIENVILMFTNLMCCLHVDVINLYNKLTSFA